MTSFSVNVKNNIIEKKMFVGMSRFVKIFLYIVGALQGCTLMDKGTQKLALEGHLHCM